ncbi:hypothetical protein DGG96_14585 [Legionella qingyii]|uniref:Uncharacterized protein n=1 Tax=Legionella qingyii TaxID=2184757 RepID=A0A317U113_9GAMM|nr:hypothetical protein DGG96_14585 [Legionella qingyii]
MIKLRYLVAVGILLKDTKNPVGQLVLTTWSVTFFIHAMPYGISKLAKFHKRLAWLVVTVPLSFGVFIIGWLILTIL